MYKTNSTIILALSLAGCAPASFYVNPDGPDTAVLTIRNVSNSTIMTHAFKVAEDCSGGKLVLGPSPSPLLAPNEATTIRVQANHPFSLNIVQRKDMKACQMAFTFTPTNGGQYTARFSSDKETCYVGMVSATSSGETKEPTLQLRTLRSPFSKDGAFCRP